MEKMVIPAGPWSDLVPGFRLEGVRTYVRIHILRNETELVEKKNFYPSLFSTSSSPSLTKLASVCADHSRKKGCLPACLQGPSSLFPRAESKRA